MSKKIYELLITPEFLSIWTASFDDYKIILMAMVLIWVYHPFIIFISFIDATDFQRSLHLLHEGNF